LTEHESFTKLGNETSGANIHITMK